MASRKRKREGATANDEEEHVLGSSIKRRIGLALESALEKINKEKISPVLVAADEILHAFSEEQKINVAAPRGVLEGRLYHYNRYGSQWRFVVDKNATVKERPVENINTKPNSSNKKVTNIFNQEQLPSHQGAVLGEMLEVLVDNDK